jgi:intein/homing endonuclease
MEEHGQSFDEDTIEAPTEEPEQKHTADERGQSTLSEKKESFIDIIRHGRRIIAEKSAIAKDSMAHKLAGIDAENCTLKEAMEKIEEDVFAGTRILEDLDARFIGSPRKIRDQIARRAAKMIYERWRDDHEKEELKALIEMDYNDV